MSVDEMTMYARTVIVSREWFDQLEAYLQADERFANTSESWALILVTPSGKTLRFQEAVMTCKCAEPTPYTKPSGKLICINKSCGLPIVDTPAPEERP